MAGQAATEHSHLSEPHVAHHSWAAALALCLPRGANTEGCLSQHQQMDGWAAICKEQSPGLIGSTVNCYEAVPARLQQPTVVLVRHFICLGSFARLITRGMIAFVTHSQVSGKDICPLLIFSAPLTNFIPDVCKLD